jgi:AcrR family transcriptional regulator
MFKSKSEETREKILDAALALFREKGFHEATMRQIAEQAGVATGLAYHYFRSKDDMVMAFYDRAKEDLLPRLEEVHDRHKKLPERLCALIQAKFEYFTPNRRFLGALMSHAADPQNPLSPFSDETRHIREADFEQLSRALKETKTNVPRDLEPYLPRILWIYQMGLILFWIYDHSEGQQRTQALVDKSVRIVGLLVRACSLPLMRPARKLVIELVTTISPPSTTGLAGAE